MDRVRVGFVGAGRLAGAMHYPALAALEGVELVAVCDRLEARARAIADQYGARRVYSDLEAMLAAGGLDAVFCVVPPQDVYAPAHRILSAGLPLFIEKPPGLTVTQCRNLARLAADRGVPAMVGFNRRYLPLLTACRQRLSGPIDLAAVTFAKHHTAGEYYDGALDILTCDVIHAVDLVRYLAGGRVVEVAASVRATAGRDYPNSWQALVTFDTGAVGALLAHWAGGTRRHHAEFHTADATCHLTLEAEATCWEADGPPVNLTAAAEAGGPEPFRVGGFLAEDAHFLDCVREGRQPSSSLADATLTMALVDRIYAAAGGR